MYELSKKPRKQMLLARSLISVGSLLLVACTDYS